MSFNFRKPRLLTSARWKTYRIFNRGVNMSLILAKTKAF